MSFRSGVGDADLDKITPNFACFSDCTIWGVGARGFIDTRFAASIEFSRERQIVAESVALASRADAERDIAVDAATVIRLSTLSTDALTSSELDLTPRLDGLVMILEGLEEDLSRAGRVVVFDGVAGVAGLKTLALAAARSEPVVLPDEDLSKPRRVVIFEFVGWFIVGLRTLALAAARSEPAVDPEDDLSKPARVVPL